VLALPKERRGRDRAGRAGTARRRSPVYFEKNPADGAVMNEALAGAGARQVVKPLLDHELQEIALD